MTTPCRRLIPRPQGAGQLFIIIITTKSAHINAARAPGNHSFSLSPPRLPSFIPRRHIAVTKALE